jgi:integrase
LEPEEARAVIAAIDRRSFCGERDHALLLFLYNTGARVSEALAVRPCDLRLERPRQVRLQGKGRKRHLPYAGSSDQEAKTASSKPLAACL